MISRYIMFGMAITILLMSIVGYFYYKSSQATIKQLTSDLATSQANVQTLKGTIVEQNKSIIRLEDTRKLDQESIISLGGELSDARKEAEESKKIFKRHNLDRLSIAKPGLIEKIINRGTKKVLKDLEKLTKPENIK